MFLYFRSFCLSLFTYIGIFACFYFFQNIFTPYGYLRSKINLLDMIAPKVHVYISQLHNQNLAINFLLNQRILDDQEKIAFQSSGLIHLIAVSGGQILPVCRFVGLILLNFIFFMFHNFVSSGVLMRIIYYIKCILFILIALLMTGLFACAGALVRVVFLSFCNELLKTIKCFSLVSSYFPICSTHFVRRVFLILLMALCFGNIFFDYSFLLSSIGATALEISAFFLKFLLYKIDISLKLKNCVEPILLTFLTSWIVSILLYPVCKVPFIMSGFANVLAAPIATILITPLSLILILLPVDNFLIQYLLKLFDFSLCLLGFVANSFQNSEYSLDFPKYLLFSYEGHFYLLLVLILLLSFSDTMRSRDEIFIRKTMRSA